jgi:D-threonate/D-erythronate kinase
MTIVRIVADDLTGALDAAAPLVGLAGPMPVFWGQTPATTDVASFALDTESRDAPVPADSWSGVFRGTELAFKKVDSLLRGRTAGEIATCLDSGMFESAVIAPAFPAQQRITRGGRQHWRARASDQWQEVDCDLPAELRRRVPIRHARSDDEIAGAGFFLCDATKEQDLCAIVAAGKRLDGNLLWVGSAGLARALVGPPPRPVETILPAPMLLVIGSHHPVTLAQIERLVALAPQAVAKIGPGATDLEDTVADLAAMLSGQGRAALVFALPDGTGADVAGPLFDRALKLAIERLAPPGSLVVTGGATLFRLVKALAAESLMVIGEPMPGIACSSLAGGRWPGATVISKSGAFGTPDLLVRWCDLVQS